MLGRFLRAGPLSFDPGILIIRLVAGASLLSFHGASKLMNFAQRKDTFSDPLGVGSTTSLTLAVGAEVFCSLLLILGLFTRLALVPLIINMSVIILIVHGEDTLKERELPILYLMIFIGLFLTGAGRYSVDSALRK